MAHEFKIVCNKCGAGVSLEILNKYCIHVPSNDVIKDKLNCDGAITSLKCVCGNKLEVK